MKDQTLFFILKPRKIYLIPERASLQTPMPPPPAANGSSIQQRLSAALELFAFCLHRLAAGKRYSLGLMKNILIAVFLLAISAISYAADSYSSVEKYLEAATDNRPRDFTYKLSSDHPPKVPNVYGVLIRKNNTCTTIFVLERTVKGFVLTDQSRSFLCLDKGYVEFIKARSNNRFDIQLYTPAYGYAFRYRYKKMRNRWRLIGYDVEHIRDEYMGGVKDRKSVNYLTNTCSDKTFKHGKLITERKIRTRANLPEFILSNFDPHNTDHGWSCRAGQ